MKKPTEPDWAAVWRKGSRSLCLLEAWDSRRAVLLVSQDDSAEKTIPKLVEHLGADRVIEAGRWTLESDWKPAVETLAVCGPVGTIFNPAGSRKVCVVVHDLDVCPGWLWTGIKALLERGIRPFNCIASAKEPDKIPGEYISFFYIWRKIGRPRK